MINIIDNAVQLVTLVVCLVLSGRRFLRSRSDDWLIIFCFYACSLLGLSYWLAYLVVFGDTPRFYVSDLSWAASYIFMLMFVANLDQRRAPSPPVPLAWLSPVVVLPQFFLYVTHGDVLLNVAECSIMAAIGYFAVRGASEAGKTAEEGPEWDGPLHWAIFLWWALQLAVWTASCFWVGEAYLPYIVCDLAVSAMYVLMLVRALRVVA